MAVEEVTGRPFPGKPEERVGALKARISYLESHITSMRERGPAGGPINFKESDREVFERYQRELAEAKLQLSQWKAQHEGRN